MEVNFFRVNPISLRPLPIEEIEGKCSEAHTLSEHRHEKTCLRGFRRGKTQTGLLSYRDKLESCNFGFSKYRYYTIEVANDKGAYQTARMRRLICTVVVRIWLKQVFSCRGSMLFRK